MDKEKAIAQPFLLNQTFFGTHFGTMIHFNPSQSSVQFSMDIGNYYSN